MNRRLRASVLASSRAALPLLAAFLFPVLATLAVAPSRAADLCSEEAFFQNHFAPGHGGKTAVDIQSIHLPAPSGTWSIDAGENGDVQLADWDKNEVLICACVTAWAPDQARADRLLRAIHVETDGGKLRAEGPWQSDGARWGVAYRIYAPRAMDLDVEAVNGGIAVKGIRGQMSLHTENGPIAIDRAGGDIEGRTTNGPVSVSLAGSHWSGKGLDVETTNGPVNISIPSHYSAELTAGTENGPTVGAYVGFSINHGRHHVTLGSGGAPIRIVTTNGPVAVHKED